MKIRLLLDMDEVLTDFTGGALAAHGWTRARLESVRPAGYWDMATLMGMTTEEFWAPINRMGERFWVELVALPWVDAAVQLADEISQEWYVVSSPSWEPGCYSGKARWLKRYFGRRFDRFFLTPHKHVFADQRTLLIDDSPRNVDRFRRAGGKALLFPSLGNSLFYWANRPVEHIRDSFGLKGASDASEVSEC